MKNGETTRALTKELGLHRSLLYRWRDRLATVEPTASDEGLPRGSREGRLYRENRQLKQALAERILEVDFFKGALQKVATRRQQSTGARASTTKSGE
jgi:transposase-like protein